MKRVFVRFIPFVCETAGDFDRKHEIVRIIEQSGFRCDLVSGGIDVWAIKNMSLLDHVKEFIADMFYWR